MDPTLEELIGKIDAKMKTLGDDKADKSAIEGLQTEIAELKKVYQKSEEERMRIKAPQLTGEEMGLKSYCNDDGSINFKTRMIQDPELGLIEQKGLLTTDENLGNWHMDLKEDHQIYCLGKLLAKGNPMPRMKRKMQQYARTAPLGFRDQITKALFDGAGSADALVPDQYRMELYVPHQAPTLVEDVFEEDTSMTRSTLTVPTITGNNAPRRRGQFTSNNPDQLSVADPAFSNATINMDGLYQHYLWNDQLEEDAAIVLATALRASIIRDIRNGCEDAILNGDSAASHQDAIATWNPRSFWSNSGHFGSSDDHRRAWRGLRAAAIDKGTTSSIASLTYKIFMTLIAQTGDFALENKVLIAPWEFIFDTLMPLEQFATIDKYGPMATNVTGELGKIGGMSVVPSKFMTADLAASGLYTGSGSTRGCLIVPRKTWKRYTHKGQGIILQQQNDITIGGVHLVANKRMSFGTLEPESASNVAYGING